MEYHHTGVGTIVHACDRSSITSFKNVKPLECTHVCCTIIVEQRTVADPVGTVSGGGGGGGGGGT